MFAPTALLVMTHNTTGLKYFCKTIGVNRVHNYKGSGVAWQKHLKQHGTDVRVGVLGFYTDESRCFEAAKRFSRENDIVASDEWANLVEETGRNGASMKGERNPFYGKKHNPETAERLRLAKIGKSVNKGAYRSPEYRAKMSALLKGKPNPLVAEKLRGKTLSEETRKKISVAGKGRVFSPEAREKIRQAALRQWAKVRQANQIVCQPADQPTE
jgi:hypothetical protein